MSQARQEPGRTGTAYRVIEAFQHGHRKPGKGDGYLVQFDKVGMERRDGKQWGA